MRTSRSPGGSSDAEGRAHLMTENSRSDSSRDIEAGTDSGTPPVASRAVVQGELRRALKSSHRNPESTVLLLRAAPEWRDEFTFITDLTDPRDPDGGPVTVTVAACPTVLAVIDALADERGPGHFLAVLTPRESAELGDSLLARAMWPEVKPVNRWDLVGDAFDARFLDSRLTLSENRWLAESLLNAQPSGGWPKLAGPMLTLETALDRLAAVRFATGDTARDSGVDAAALLVWTGTAGAADFGSLREAERTGLIERLRQTAKPATDVVFGIERAAGDKQTKETVGGLIATGRIRDAIPFGLAVAALYGQDDALTARGRAEERYLAGYVPAHETMRAFGEVAESLVIRWTDNGHAPEAADACERAERILAELGGAEAVGESNVLETGLNARFAELAEALSRVISVADDIARPSGTKPSSESLGALADTESALRRVTEHGRKLGRSAEVDAADAAVRLARWLMVPEDPPAVLADGAVRALRSWAWAERAHTVVAKADTSRVPRLTAVYGTLQERVIARLASLADALRKQAGAGTEDSALLRTEEVLTRIARPVAERRLPVIVVLDGVTVGTVCELAEEFTRDRMWTETGRREDGREPVLFASSGSADWLATLLTGEVREVDQAAAAESAGFAAFWGRRKARLLRTEELVPEQNRSLAQAACDAVADASTVVGVVLSGSPEYLRPVLDEARRAGRPVILLSGNHRGPLPEVVGSVITLLPSVSLRPPGWYDYDAYGHAPVWWDAQALKAGMAGPGLPEQGPRRASTRSKRAVPETDDDALFGVAEIVNTGPVPAEASASAAESPGLTVGMRVMRSQRIADQRKFLRRAPSDESAAALLDALDRAGGRLTRAEAAEAAGASPARMSGYIAQAIRLLNIDGYPVLQEKDDGRTVVLNPQLLRQQFLGE